MRSEFSLRINLLPEEVWGRIAAGEVVERPASAVKELVENSLDIGARRVTVLLWDGGKSRIVVEDDGAGIPFDELPLAIAQHATSKLATTDDLNAILTLGYRGEALASIAAVSEIEIRSRFAEHEGGLIRASEGKISEHISTACAAGTRVQIDNLFFNLPARRKFMKTAISELRRATNVIRDYAFAWVGVSFGLMHDGKRIFTTDGNGDRRRTLSQFWGSSPEPRMVEVSAGNLKLECWHQFFPGRGRNEVSAFVNGRSVNDPLIRGAVSSFGKELSGNWALFFTISPSLIDVNIHPAKAEIRFRHTGEVFEALKNASEALNAPLSMKIPRLNYEGGVQKFNLQHGDAKPLYLNRRDLKIQESGERLFSRVSPVTPEKFGIPPENNPFDVSNNLINEEPKQNFSLEEKKPDAEYLSQSKTGYLIFETESSFVLMDPHAAHERITYERIKNLSKVGFRVQNLLLSEAVPPTLSVELRERENELRRLGFDFGEDDGALSVVGIPDVLSDVPPLQALRAAVSSLNDGGEGNIDELLAARWATLACKSSVKLTQKLCGEEAIELWRLLMKCEQPFTCPHGRPTLLTMDNSELTKHFGRSER